MVPLISFVSALVILTIAVAIMVWRARRASRQREHRDLLTEAADTSRRLHRRAVEREFAAAVATSESVDEVVALVKAALLSLDERRPYELHLVDEDGPALRLAFATGDPIAEPRDASPWDSRAATEGATLVYPSTDVDELCRHLESRLVEHCSAVAIPLLARGRSLGVLYATGPRGVAPSDDLIDTYEAIARTAAGAIAGIEGFARADALALRHHEAGLDDVTIDLTEREATGIGTSADALSLVNELIEAHEPFCVLLFDVDGFGRYHGEHGVAVGDEALVEVRRAAARELGGSGLFRLDGDRLCVVLADASPQQALRCAEDLRNAIARALRARELPPLTVSFGVVEASAGTTAERVFLGVHDALYNACARGDASTVIGLDTAAKQP